MTGGKEAEFVKVGNRRNANKQNIYQLRSSKSVEYAVDAIRKSPVAPFVKALYLYGSCARGEQTYGSDVDLFLELQPDFDTQKYKDDVILLKGRVSPVDMNMAEVDLKVVVGDEWRKNQMLYYQNILKEGVDIWQKI